MGLVSGAYAGRDIETLVSALVPLSSGPAPFLQCGLARSILGAKEPTFPLKKPCHMTTGNLFWSPQ